MHTVNAHGAGIPVLGFGTFELEPQDTLRMVAKALEIGYRHIDTAQMYKNEAQVGEALEHSPVKRDEVFLTTKVWVDRFRNGELQRSAEESLNKLRTGHVDLLLLHWPNTEVPLQETISALNEALRSGLTRHIGVSNFSTSLIKEALSHSEAPLAVNQVEYHPFLSQRPVLNMVRTNKMALTAYSPLAQGKVFDNETLTTIGERHGRNAGQVALRWLVQQTDVIAIPRSKSEAHAQSNFNIFDFELSPAEMADVSALAQPDGRLISPAGLAPDWDVDEAV